MNTSQLTSPRRRASQSTTFEGIRSRLIALATSRAVAIAVVLYVASIALLTLADLPIAREAPGVAKPDLTFGYTHAQIVELFTAFGQGGRRAYAISLAVDMITPLTLAIATILVAARAAPGWLGLLSVAPLTFFALDIVENIAFAAMLIQYPDISPALVAATSPITMIKLSAWVIALPTLVLGVLALAIRWLRGRNAP